MNEEAELLQYPKDQMPLSLLPLLAQHLYLGRFGGDPQCPSELLIYLLWWGL